MLFSLVNAKFSALFDAIYDDDIREVNKLIESGADVNEKGDYETPLILAIKRQNYDIAKFLIDNGADIESKVKAGVTPLFEAVYLKQPRIVKLLLDKKAIIDKIGINPYNPSRER